jgi:CheY-like chemotaxis protein
MRPRVLIVDDERTFADVVAELLVDEGYTVLRAYDGLSALRMLSSEESQPDVVLCDVMLPALSGDRLAAEVRRLFPDRRLPIVLVSASADPRVDLPDVRFLPKPLDFGELLPLLHELINPRPHVAMATL